MEQRSFCDKIGVKRQFRVALAIYDSTEALDPNKRVLQRTGVSGPANAPWTGV